MARGKRQTGRAIVHVPYSTKRGNIYNSILIGFERWNHKYTLPGGGVRKGESTADAALRELFEEYSLEGANPRLVYRFEGHKVNHDVYTVDVPKIKDMKQAIQLSDEVLSLGFLNAGRYNRIPATRRTFRGKSYPNGRPNLEAHIQSQDGLLGKYKFDTYCKTADSGIYVPSHLIRGFKANLVKLRNNK